MSNLPVNTNNSNSKRDLYKRSRNRSADSVVSAETSADTSREHSSEGSSRKGMSFLSVDVTSANKWEDLANCDQSESPYLSALNLPTIIEEDMEEEAGKTFKWKKN